MADEGYIRIGELSRRVGVSPELLRAWERRYGLLRPDRSPGRFRLYSDADLARVQAMRGNLANGLSAAEAARLALASPAPARPVPAAEAGGGLEGARGELGLALESFDEAGAQAVLDRLLAAFGLDSVLREVVLPTLRELGERWARGEVTVGQEHFASTLLRGRLLALGRGWGRGGGPRALVAAAPGELHDLGLVVFALALRERGWRITYLGTDTPLETVADAARRIAPDVIVLAALDPARLRSAVGELESLAKEWRLVLAGAGATRDIAERAGAELASEGPVEAAETLAAQPA